MKHIITGAFVILALLTIGGLITAAAVLWAMHTAEGMIP